MTMIMMTVESGEEQLPLEEEFFLPSGEPTTQTKYHAIQRIPVSCFSFPSLFHTFPGGSSRNMCACVSFPTLDSFVKYTSRMSETTMMMKAIEWRKRENMLHTADKEATKAIDNDKRKRAKEKSSLNHPRTQAFATEKHSFLQGFFCE
jgi:hypothetical protein